jgi:prevent-host-death family protein
MSETVKVHDAKTHFSRLLDKAHAGEEIVLSKAGKPYARLMPLATQPGQRQPSRLKRSGAQLDASFFDALPDIELDAWEGW